ncbi:MAG TPA: IPT/TIG domain-containing protein [Acidimicrobiales bacterium]
MSDRSTGERPPGTPSQRALGAMESAVRRARERAGVVTGSGPIQEDTQPVSVTSFFSEDPPTPPAPLWSGPQPPWSGPPPSAPARTAEPARREHWLTISVAAVAALVVLAGIALAVSSGGGGQQGASPPAPTPTTAHTGGPANHPAPGRHTGRSSGSSTTTSTAPPATPGGPPVIASLVPASGAPGQGIQVAGSNFLSSSGQIVATFNGQVASTSCPAPNTCTVTVPPMSGSSSAQVTITTASGTSNAVTFTYS